MSGSCVLIPARNGGWYLCDHTQVPGFELVVLQSLKRRRCLQGAIHLLISTSGLDQSRLFLSTDLKRELRLTISDIKITLILKLVEMNCTFCDWMM